LKGEDARGRAGDRVDEGGNNHLWGTGGRGVHGARYLARCSIVIFIRVRITKPLKSVHSYA